MSKQPNVVFLFSDQHNHSVMGHVGDPYIKTPNLDRLAKNGVTLTDCYCPAPLCVPSRISMLTARMPHDTGCLNNYIELPGDHPTVAHTLQIAGYETVLAGRMHFYGHDQYHGFEKHFTYDATPAYRSEITYDNVFGEFTDSVKQRRAALAKTGAGVCGGYLFDEAVTDSTVEFLENRTDDRPLFMTIGYFCPHPPYIAPKELFDYYYDLLPEIETDPKFTENLHPAMKEWKDIRGVTQTTKEEKRSMRAAYYAQIEFMDRMCGRVIDAVEKTLGLDNTIFVYSTDHGEAMGINDLYFKTHFYEDSVKVPAIFSFPKEFMSGAKIEATTSLMDLTQTIVEACGAKALPHTHWSAKSLLNVLKGNEKAEEGRTIISEMGVYPPTGDKPSAMVKKGDWKLMSYYGYEHPSLYDLKNDPKEQNDLGKDPAYAEKIAELQAILDKEWDPQAVYDKCIKEFEFFKVVKEWAYHTKFDFPPLFKVENAFEANYLCKEREGK